MKLCAAQISSDKGQIPTNIAKHVRVVKLAASNGAGLVVFPELSLTGYELSLARELASSQDDPRLDELQLVSDELKIIICAGLPIKTDALPMIGMVIFSPHLPRQTYCKQHLHLDEVPEFIPGNTKLRLDIRDCLIAPAICYESLLEEHAASAASSGANIYFASVSKSSRGVEKAQAHMPVMAKKFGMLTLMANSVGPSDNFVGYGCSSLWDGNGGLRGQLDSTSEGILVLDTETLLTELYV